MRPVKAAWINDVVSSLGRSPEQEIEEELSFLQEKLGYRVDVVAQGRGMDVVRGKDIDLLVFDYGGASGSCGNFVWDQFEAMIRWAREHEGKLVLLYSSFTGKMYENLMKEETKDRIHTENILHWVDTTLDFEKDESWHAKASAWFLSGDFEPYTSEETVAELVTKLATRKRKERKKCYSHDEIWARAEKRTLSVQMAYPWVENEDGTGQGITCFRTFCTDVYADDDETLLGSIGGGTGFVTLTYQGKGWLIKHSDLWHAFMEALGVDAGGAG